MSNKEVAAPAEHDWLTWDQTLRALGLGNVGLRPWDVLADWCSQGLIETRAKTLMAGGNVSREETLAPAVWTMCRAGASHGHLDPMGGAIRINYDHEETGRGTMSALGVMFRKDQVFDLLAHVDPKDLENSLAETGPWLGGKLKTTPVIEAQPIKVETRGRKPDKERWKLFWFALIEIANEGRLPNGFESATALREEVDLMMRDQAFDPDYTRDIVGQVFKKFSRG